MVAWPYGQIIMPGGVCRGERLFTSWKRGSREQKSYWGLGTIFKGMYPVTCFLQVDPTQ
jgi:hypothetical protein